MLKYLQTITPGSGGQAFYNTNDLNDSLARVVNNGSDLYSLTYSPTNSNVDGKYWRIQVTLIRGKHTLALVKHLEAENNELITLEISTPSLEDVFIELTGRRLRD